MPASPGVMTDSATTRKPSCGKRVVEYIRNHLRREGDSEKDVQHKVRFIVYLSGLLLVTLGGSSTFPSVIFVSIAVALHILWIWVRREVSEAFLRIAMVSFTVGCYYVDALAASSWDRQRVWPLFVIFVDVMLVIEAPRYITTAVVGLVIVWLCAVQVEYSYRAFGLFDFPDSDSYERRRHMFECEKPPCAAEYRFDELVVRVTPGVTVFLLDFILTRGFADQVLAEQKKMAAAVDAAEYLAGRLADFDLEAATEYLNDHVVPDELAASFNTLVLNLHSYRPYLPSEIIRTPDPTNNRPSQDASNPGMLNQVSNPSSVPGMVDPEVALVFTDIRSSTALWEHSRGTSMQDALSAHDSVMRAALETEGGYEVKTVGDSFMISFASCISAVRFGHAVQTELAAMEWPEGLTRPNADDGFRMLSVRMGMHCGEAVVQQNTLTGRYDYFGPTVNRAARVEPFGAPGAVTVTAEVVAAVGGVAVLSEAEGFVVVPYSEERTGKGLRTQLVLTALIPYDTAGVIEASVRGIAESGGGIKDKDCVGAVVEQDFPTPSTTPTTSIESESHNDSFVLINRRVFSAKFAEGACVGVIQFARFERDDVSIMCDRQAFKDEVAQAEHRLQVLSTSVQMTRGHLTSVVSGTAWVSWGLQKQCPQYVNESSRCMALLEERLPDALGAAPAFHAGLVTGPLGTVELSASSGGRRFITVLGACVELGMALCVGAASMGTCVLAASVEGSEAAGGHADLDGVRLVQGWERTEFDVDAYELDLARLARGPDRARLLESTSPSEAGSLRRRSVDFLDDAYLTL